MEVPAIHSIMTPAPRAVDAQQDALTAGALMKQHGIRHVPVLKKGKLFGILSDRDLRGVEAVLQGSPGVLGPAALSICSRAPFTVSRDEPLDRVATAMADRRIGAAIVVDGEKMVGIVTTVDLCRALAQIVGQIREDSDAA